MKLSIGVKALNEESHIALSLGSAVQAAQALGGEVILADSGSTDRTLAIARTFPVRIFQLLNPSDRSCGAAAQLAFQYARGEYFYLLDGDMVLDPDFIPMGVRWLEANPECAGVGGYMRERNIACEESEIRATNMDRSRRPGAVDRLDGGGLYRTSAVRETGVFADRNLHGCEEFDLAARLQSRGWKLARIDHAAIDHFGHTMGGYRLLLRRLQSGYLGGAGEVFRAAVGKRHLSLVLSRLSHFRNAVAILVWWVVLACTLRSIYALAVLVFAPLCLLWFRRRSFRLGLYCFVAWNFSAVGVIAGVLRRRISPDIPVESIEISNSSTERGVDCLDADAMPL